MNKAALHLEWLVVAWNSFRVSKWLSEWVRGDLDLVDVDDGVVKLDRLTLRVWRCSWCHSSRLLLLRVQWWVMTWGWHLTTAGLVWWWTRWWVTSLPHTHKHTQYNHLHHSFTTSQSHFTGPVILVLGLDYQVLGHGLTIKSLALTIKSLALTIKSSALRMKSSACPWPWVPSPC